MQVRPLPPRPDSVMSLQRRPFGRAKDAVALLILRMILSEPLVRGHALVCLAFVIFNTPNATKHSTVTGKMIQFSMSQPQAL
ncbi:hypothetical protein IQ26_04855 [Mesorhizobium tianshanense]|uniref:Uncharacterized protein n=1 Tax=Mesorhizobium tianshanense TaxID=39844 RepID=A0A562NCX6_9HYPH|nr:hypothetical protein IQ26_04855 [Mesorhizobium tianshanense]